jgi:hypothetical protein
MSQDVRKLRCRIAQVPLYNLIPYKIGDLCGQNINVVDFRQLNKIRATDMGSGPDTHLKC